jgi:hypothetical protein
MKIALPNVLLGVSMAIFVLGFAILCNCPGWYATSAVFAGLAAWKSIGKTRIWALALFGAALVMTSLHALAEQRLTHRVQEMRRTHQQN